MATIVIKDLLESTELDRQAMRAIAGGSRFRSGATSIGRPAQQRARLFDFSARGATRTPAAKPPSR